MATTGIVATTDVALPKVVSRAEWLAAHKDLLAREKEATRARDAVNAQRRRLPLTGAAQPVM